MMGVRVAFAMLIAGWLANALAAPDRSVAAGIEAYEQGEWDSALEQFAKAEERLGERPELHFNKGLVHLAKEDVEAARTAFEHGSESERDDVRASSFYELGNIAFDAEEWDLAVQHYVDALKARPEHASAKWNLELALQRQREQQQEQQDEQQDQQQDEQQGQDDQEQQEEEQEGDDPQNEQEQGEDQKQDGEQGQQDEKQSDDPRSQEEETQQPEREPEGEQDESQDSSAPQGADQEGKGAKPKALDRADIERALKELDEQDQFRLGRPLGPPPAIDKDW